MPHPDHETTGPAPDEYDDYYAHEDAVAAHATRLLASLDPACWGRLIFDAVKLTQVEESVSRQIDALEIDGTPLHERDSDQ